MNEPQTEDACAYFQNALYFGAFTCTDLNSGINFTFYSCSFCLRILMLPSTQAVRTSNSRIKPFHLKPFDPEVFIFKFHKVCSVCAPQPRRRSSLPSLSSSLSPFLLQFFFLCPSPFFFLHYQVTIKENNGFIVALRINTIQLGFLNEATILLTHDVEIKIVK